MAAIALVGALAFGAAVAKFDGSMFGHVHPSGRVLTQLH
jgi:hypothetical protein